MSCIYFEQKVTLAKTGTSIDGCMMAVTVTARARSSCSNEEAYEKAKYRAQSIIDKCFNKYKCKESKPYVVYRKYPYYKVIIECKCNGSSGTGGTGATGATGPTGAMGPTGAYPTYIT